MNRLLVGKWYVRIALLYLIIFINGPWLHALATPNTLQQRGRIVGRVTDVQGAPLSGASVRIAGGQRSVATDDEGRFSLTVTPGEHIVEVSYISYGTKQQTVAVREGANNLFIKYQYHDRNILPIRNEFYFSCL
ncbi:carboxypeptidase regulatory-like domain-containing protein [Parapedobacter sp. GCM10030251]|uniref:carboxypeptidase regulatory-like domain-containing protein n=1 Tax=Parapedobacter sp. GCM10030251 TaxID=3273419 RepID=UPI00360D9431